MEIKFFIYTHEHAQDYELVTTDDRMSELLRFDPAYVGRVKQVSELVYSYKGKVNGPQDTLSYTRACLPHQSLEVLRVVDPVAKVLSATYTFLGLGVNQNQHYSLNIQTDKKSYTYQDYITGMALAMMGGEQEWMQDAFESYSTAHLLDFSKIKIFKSN